MTVIKVLISYILMVDICNENEHIYEKYKDEKKFFRTKLIQYFDWKVKRDFKMYLCNISFVLIYDHINIPI